MSMKTLTRIAFTVICLLLALLCYFIGIPAGGVVFLVLGVGFELLFWFGVFSGTNTSVKTE